MPAENRKPAGNAIRWTPEDISRLAEVTPEDVASAKAVSERLMPKKLKPLLNAKKRGRNARDNP